MNYNPLKQSTDSSGTIIDDIIKCYICLGKIQDACMCPNCQKLTCQKCLQKWIIEKKNQCPHCRNPLRLSQVIKIGFMNDVANVSLYHHIINQ